MQQKKGLVHLYTGNAKGKTTAALGLGLRAAGHGWQVYVIQFMKGQVNYGELKTIQKLENYKIKQFGRPDFVSKDNPDQLDIEGAERGLAFAREVIASSKYDLVILDEIICALDFKLIQLTDVLDLIEHKPTELELVLTGRGAPQELVAACDYVSELTEIKHPYQLGVQAREGIEY